MEVGSLQKLKFIYVALDPPDHVQHSCAIKTTNFHHLPLCYMGWDRELGESTPVGAALGLNVCCIHVTD
jgi:hypothetical protein